MSDRPFHYRVLSTATSGIVGLFILIDFAISPVFRPLARFIQQSGPIALLRRLSRRMPSYVALLCLAVPLAVAEPAKLLGLYLIGEEHYLSGVGTLVAAYLVSLMLVDTIYEGARPQLRSIGWFATVVDRISAIRIAVMSRVRATRVYQAAHREVTRLRAWLKRRRLRATTRWNTSR